MGKRNETERAILDAARTEFLEKGYAAARVDEIAKKSGVSKVLMYRYFGDKSEMFSRVVEAQLEEFERGKIAPPGLSGREPLIDWIKRTIQGHFKYLLRHPDLARLMALETAERGLSVERLKTRRRAGMAVMREVIEDGQKRGILKSGMDAAQLVFTLAAANYFYFAYRGVSEEFFNQEVDSEGAVAARLEHISALVDALL